MTSKQSFQEEEDKVLLNCFARSGISTPAMAALFGISASGIRYYLRKLKLSVERREKALSDLSHAERSALCKLLNFVPADIVSEWLGIEFRGRR